MGAEAGENGGCGIVVHGNGVDDGRLVSHALALLPVTGTSCVHGGLPL